MAVKTGILYNYVHYHPRYLLVKAFGQLKIAIILLRQTAGPTI